MGGSVCDSGTAIPAISTGGGSPSLANWSVFFITAVYFSTVILVGAIGNILTIYTIGAVRSLRTTSNALVASLALSDFATCLVTLPVLYSRLRFPGFYREHETLCKLSFYLMMPFKTVSMNHLQVIAANRYFIITRTRHRYNMFWSRRRVLMMIAGMWVYSAFLNSLPLFGFGEIGFRPDWQTCGSLASNKYTWWYRTVLVLNVFQSCGVVSPLFFVLAFKKIHDTKRRLHQRQFNRVTAAATYRGFSREEMAVTRMVLLVFILFVATWFPYIVLHLASGAAYVPVGVSKVALVFAISSSIFNAVIYAGINKNFRKGFCERFRSRRSATIHVAVLPNYHR